MATGQATEDESHDAAEVEQLRQGLKELSDGHLAAARSEFDRGDSPILKVGAALTHLAEERPSMTLEVLSAVHRHEVPPSIWDLHERILALACLTIGEYERAIRISHDSLPTTREPKKWFEIRRLGFAVELAHAEAMIDEYHSEIPAGVVPPAVMKGRAQLNLFLLNEARSTLRAWLIQARPWANRSRAVGTALLGLGEADRLLGDDSSAISLFKQAHRRGSPSNQSWAKRNLAQALAENAIRFCYARRFKDAGDQCQLGRIELFDARTDINGVTTRFSEWIDALLSLQLSAVDEACVLKSAYHGPAIPIEACLGFDTRKAKRTGYLSVGRGQGRDLDLC